jgi:hypothetical protein
MSIKYLQDQQLNQVQQSPNNSPWAKLIAQSEMLERNKMRQPQGQAPQGTVAGNIQQQLMAAQEQEGERQNADLYKSQMLAQLIGSGQIPANFMSSSQGYADGGLTQPQAGTGAYRGIMMPNQSPQMQGQRPTYTPPNSQDPAAQEKKHGLIQSLIDNSIFKAPTTESFMNNLGDMASGKFLSRGFAEGGSLFGYDPNLNSSGLDPRILEAQDAENAARLRATEMVRKMHVGDAANRGVLSKLERDTHPLVKRLMEQEAQNAANLRATDIPRKMHLGDAANTKIPQVPPSMTEQLSAAAQKSPLDTMWAKMSEADRLNAMNRANVPPEVKPTPSMTESMSAAAQNPPRIDTLASKMSATDKANDIKFGDPMAPGATTLEEVAAKAKQGLGSLGEAAKVVGRPIAKVAGALSPIGDLMMANKFTGGSNALLAQALSGQTPSGAMQGDIPEVAKDLMTAPSVPDWAKNIGSAINSKVPSVPQTDISQFGVDTKSAIPQQPTIGDFSGSVPETKGPTANDKGVIINPHSANKHENTTANIAAINRAHGQDQPQPTTPVDRAVTQAAALAQADQAVSKSSDTGMGQGSILDSLYSKLKDSDVDYSDLAKRISQNEYDLARERKDGTFNAILGGVGAALTQAGTYQTAGDRVFKPGLGAIAGAGIMGGLKMSAASDEAISKKSQDNMTAMIALKKLKRESMNDVLDALSAQKQNEVYAQSVANTALAHKDTAANAATKNLIDFKQVNINEQMALKNMEHLDAQIADLYTKASSDPNLQGKVNLAADKAKTAKDVLTSLINGMVQPSDPRYIEARSNFNAAFADLNSLGGVLKIPTTVVAPNAGGQTPQTTKEWANQGYIKR